MTTTTVYADTSDGNIRSFAADYATARAGTGSFIVSDASTGSTVGQSFASPNYFIWEGFQSFDTSTIPGTDTVTQVDLGIYGTFDDSATDFTLEARADDWGTSITSGDWVAGSNLSSLTRLATFASSGFSASGYNTFTEDGTNFQSAVDTTGDTRLLLCSDRTVSGTAPTQGERVSFSTADESGTTQDPKLVVTHGPPPGTPIVAAAETDVARTLTASRAVDIARAVETSAAAALIGPTKLPIVAATETDVARTLTVHLRQRTNPVTADDLLSGRVGQVNSAIRFEVLDADLNHVDNLHPVLHTGQVRWSASSRIQRTLDGLRIPPDEADLLTEGEHRIRPVWVLSTGDEYRLGVFVYLGGDLTSGPGGDWLAAESMPDRAYQLDQGLTDAITLPASTDVSTKLASLASDAGITETDLETSSLTTGSTPLAWAPGGPSRWEVAERLHTLLGWLPPHFDRDGTLIGRPVPTPGDEAPDHVYSTTGQHGRVAWGSRKIKRTIRPNTYLVRSTGADDSDISALHRIDPDAEGSSARVGFDVVTTHDEPGLASAAQALEVARALARRDAQRGVRFSSPPDPRHDTYGIVELDGTRYVEVEWNLPLQPGADMSHVLAPGVQ